MSGINLKFTVIQKNLLISMRFQNYKSPPNMSSMSTHDHYVAAFPSSLRSSGVPISTHTKKLVIFSKRKNHTKRQTQARRVS